MSLSLELEWMDDSPMSTQGNKGGERKREGERGKEMCSHMQHHTMNCEYFVVKIFSDSQACAKMYENHIHNITILQYRVIKFFI